MANFDQHNYDIRSARAENPWSAPSPERRDVDAPVRKSLWHIPIVRILAIVLLVSLALCCLYTTLVHPIYRLQLRLLPAKYFEIDVVTNYNYWNNSMYYSGTDHATIQVYVDQNAFVIKNGSSGSEEYYKVVDGVLYKSNKWTDGWEKAEDDEQASSSFYAGLLERRNYKYATDRLFAWRYQDSDLYFKSTFGKFKFIYESSTGETKMTFGHFDLTHHTPPWEE